MEWAIAMKYRADDPCHRPSPVLGPQQVRERLKDDLVFDVQQRERTMESRRLWDVDASRMPRLERAAEKALWEICQIRVEGDLVGVVDVPIEPLVLVIAAGIDSAPRPLKVLLALRVG